MVSFMKEFRIEELAEVVSGGTPSTKNSAYWDGDILWVTPKDLSNLSKKWICSSISTITVEGLKNSAARMLPVNSVLLSSRAPIGYLALAGKPLCTNQGFKSMICNKDIILPEYLYYYLQTKVEDLNNISTGSTFKELSASLLKSYTITIHELALQQHIVDILGSIDNSIENDNKKIENLINFGQLKYQEDISSNDYEYIALSKLVKISRGASPRPIQNYLTTTGHSWVKISDVTSLSTPFLFETKEYITDEGTNHSVAVYPNDLILSNSATPGIPVFMETNAFVHDGWLIIKDFKRITPNYLFWVLKNDRNIILSQGNGSIFTNLKTDILKSHEIPVPSKEKMEKLDNLYSTILLKIKHLTKENLKLNELKQLYLKKFFG